MESKLNCLYEFGPFRLDSSEHTLFRAGQVVPLTPKAFDVLVALLERHGHLVGKEELLNRVWGDSFVEENNLADNISRVRKALGDGENGQKFIETVPRRGYRFIASVQELNGEGAAAIVPLSAASEAAAPLPATRIASPLTLPKHPTLILGVLGLIVLILVGVWTFQRLNLSSRAESLAVLPFSSEPQTEYLSDGITESLINNLSLLSHLRVTARATAFSYKGKEVNPQQVGKDLKVSTVLTGRLALRDDILTVQVEMVDAATGAQKWGERYQRKLSDIFAVEEEIGRQITEKLRLKLSSEEQHHLAKRYTDNAAVYQLYLQGLYLFNKKTEDAVYKAVDYFQQAIAKDPQYAPSYPALANCYLMLSAKEGPTELLPKAKAAVVKALEIDNNLAEAHSSLGHLKWVYDLDLAGAQSEIEQALKLNPNSAVVHYVNGRVLADTGQFDEAYAQARRAIELDPLSLQYRKSVPYILYLSRRYDEAIADYQKLIAIAPEFPQAQRELGLAYEQKGLYQEAFTQLQKTYEMPENYGKTMLRADIGYLYAVWGKKTEAQHVLSELIKKSEQSYVSAYDIAIIHAGLGDIEQAFVWLDKAIEQRPFWLCWLKLDPRLDGLRTDPRFNKLSQRAGLNP